MRKRRRVFSNLLLVLILSLSVSCAGGSSSSGGGGSDSGSATDPVSTISGVVLYFVGYESLSDPLFMTYDLTNAEISNTLHLATSASDAGLSLSVETFPNDFAFQYGITSSTHDVWNASFVYGSSSSESAIQSVERSDTATATTIMMDWSTWASYVAMMFDNSGFVVIDDDGTLRVIDYDSGSYTDIPISEYATDASVNSSRRPSFISNQDSTENHLIVPDPRYSGSTGETKIYLLKNLRADGTYDSVTSLVVAADTSSGERISNGAFVTNYVDGEAGDTHTVYVDTSSTTSGYRIRAVSVDTDTGDMTLANSFSTPGETSCSLTYMEAFRQAGSDSDIIARLCTNNSDSSAILYLIDGDDGSIISSKSYSGGTYTGMAVNSDATKMVVKSYAPGSSGVSDLQNILYYLDISTPSSMTELGTYEIDGMALGIMRFKP